MGVKQQDKFTISLMSALLFFVVANPETFKIMRRLLGGWVSSPTGCPTTKGLVLHAVVYLLITWLLMNINRVERADGSTTDPTASDSTSASGGDDTPTSVGASSGDSGDDDNAAPVVPMDPTPVATAPSVQPYTGDEAGTYSTCSCQNGKTVMIMN